MAETGVAAAKIVRDMQSKVENRFLPGRLHAPCFSCDPLLGDTEVFTGDDLAGDGGEDLVSTCKPEKRLRDGDSGSGLMRIVDSGGGGVANRNIE